MFAIHETLLDKDPQVRKRALYLACTLATSVDNIHECIFNDYLMIHSIFQPILKLIIDPSVSSLAFDAMVLLSILSNYKKYETINPYLSNLSKIKDTRILKVHTFAVFCRLTINKKQFLASLVMETFWKCRL